jgi:hypothetical protein
MQEAGDNPIKHSLEQMGSLIEAEDARVRRALKDEEAAGGPLNQALSTEIRRTHRMRVDQITMMDRIGPQQVPNRAAKPGGVVAQLLQSLLPARGRRPGSLASRGNNASAAPSQNE